VESNLPGTPGGLTVPRLAEWGLVIECPGILRQERRACTWTTGKKPPAARQG